jgi:hypothetical protein
MRTRGALYGGKLEYWHRKALPIVEVGTTQETEYPFRLGKCLVFRVPFTHPGFYLGAWVSNPRIHRDDDDAIDHLLAEAMRSRSAWKPEDGAYDDFFKD